MIALVYSNNGATMVNNMVYELIPAGWIDDSPKSGKSPVVKNWGIMN